MTFAAVARCLEVLECLVGAVDGLALGAIAMHHPAKAIEARA